MNATRFFDSVTRAYADDLYRYAYYLCDNRHTAQDLVQDTFVLAWTSIHQLRDPGAAKAWLIQSMRRKYFRAYVKPWRLAEFQTPLSIETSAEALAVEGVQAQWEVSDSLDMQSRLHALPAQLREAIVLQLLFGYSVREIAKLTCATEQAVQARLHRARSKLTADSSRTDANVVSINKRSLR